ncbi:hypothetical protein OH77DRAFT_1010112 [Trametes cingulata]|nr:hypothetical protein OH77DRAFT_1010112 [Trametes cingulata]
MAFPTISNLRQSPYFNTAKAQGAVKNGVFGFKLAKSGSELYLGGTNTKLYTGAIEYHAVTGSGFWQISAASLRLGSTSVLSGRLGHDDHLRPARRRRDVLQVHPRLAAVRPGERLLLVPVQLRALECRLQLGREDVDDLRCELQLRKGKQHPVYWRDRGGRPGAGDENLLVGRQVSPSCCVRPVVCRGNADDVGRPGVAS